MKLSYMKQHPWIMAITCAIVTFCVLTILLKNARIHQPLETPAIESSASVPSQLPSQNSPMENSPEVKSDYSQTVKSDLIRQLQPEAEKFVEKEQSAQNDSKPSKGNLSGKLISVAYKGETDEERIEILKSYLTHPDLTEEDLYLINLQLAQWLVGVKDYEAASALYDEQESHWVDNPTKTLGIKIWRADLDFAKGDRESAIDKLSEIIALPLADDPAEYGQVHNILSIAPSWLASYYKRDGNVDAAIDLLWKNMERTIEWGSSHSESLPVGEVIVNNLNLINSYELDDGRISPEEARKRVNDLLKQLNAIRPEYASSGILWLSVGDAYNTIDVYTSKLKAETEQEDVSLKKQVF